LTCFFFKKKKIDATPAQIKALDALKFDLQVKSQLNEPEVQKNFKLGKSKKKKQKK
jgi:large subunit ribosomal protein L35